MTIINMGNPEYILTIFRIASHSMNTTWLGAVAKKNDTAHSTVSTVTVSTVTVSTVTVSTVI